MRRVTFSAPLCATALIALCAIVSRAAQAQSAVITGKVTGRQGEPLGGAIVAIEELGTAVATTTSGTYTLTVSPDKAKGQTVTVRARYIGYKPDAKQVTLTAGTQTQNFELVSDPMRLDAVVVTGVAEATERKKLTFAVGNVDASQLNQAPAVSALGGLEGKVAGVRLIQPNGAPGGAPNIRLRGATALTSPSACNTQPCPSTDAPGPLVVVDGTITHHSLADISPQDIERVEVVKGAAASSLYGSNAANGVVQIFTKRGDRVPDGKLAVTVRNEYGQSFRPKQIPITHAHPYRTADSTYTDSSGNQVLKGDFIDANGRLRGPTAVPSAKPDGIADVPYTDYPHPINFDVQRQLLTHGPYYTNYISIGQRKGNTNYNVSFENTKQDGIMRLLKGYKRQNFRVNLDQSLTPRLDLSVGGFFARSNNNEATQGPGSPFFVTGFLEPYVNLFAKNPCTQPCDSTPYAAFIPHQQPNAANPLYVLANEQINTDRTRYSGYAKTTYRLTDWLSLEGHYNYDFESSNYSRTRPKGFLSATGVATSGFLTKTDSGGRAFNTGATVTSVRTFRLGSWNVRNTTKAAYEYEDQKASNFTLFANAFTVVATPEFNAVDFAQLSPGSSNETIRTKNYYVLSGFDIRDRYLVDGLVRWDGSSLFGADSRWQRYYRVSGAYRLSQDFHINGIDELKLRASYGTAGLRPTFDAQYETYAIVGGLPKKQTLGNRALKPARSGEMELGGNVDFLGRFSLEYSYSRKETKDEIMAVRLSGASGYLYQWQNAGTLLGRTHELSLGVIVADKPDFSWRVNVAADRTRQKITQLNVPAFLVGPGGYGGNASVTQAFLIAPGETFGVFYGTRIVRSFAELCDDPKKQAAGCGPGLTYDPANYIVNEDGYLVEQSAYHTINERFIPYVNPAGKSVVKIGDVNPDFNASFTTNLRYKNFSAYALVDWVQGGSIYNGTRQWAFGTGSVDRAFDQSGKPAVDCTGTTDPAHCPYSTGKKPVAYYGALYNSINPTDFFVENGTYVKIKEINVSYNIGRTLLENMHIGGISGITLGVIGRNLFTFTDYSGYDPEVAGLTGDAFSFRWDGFSYPNFRQFTGFVEIHF